ncbi:MAG: hypothetical protein BGO98_40090 [Myxococcales bacterium 68-20]|nr:MAG: hypothetical protein BGO98_40090 [Myxococcales bacterium 68-20]
MWTDALQLAGARANGAACETASFSSRGQTCPASGHGRRPPRRCSERPIKLELKAQVTEIAA